MPATQIYKTPGVYVAELTAFPPSVVGVATAIPVFIGYTERATIDGKPVLNKPVRIDSLAAFEEVFGQGYRAIYNLEEVKNPKGDNYDFRVLKPDSVPTWVYYRLTATGSSLPPLLSLLNPPSGGEGEDAALART
ncbi:MAG TPA: hypothetical protein VFQ39_06475, partial [Longimicrobium sp.]|nr:hypothetical protein [Longimicrobium sp.]